MREKKYVLIIDEINRANVGEVLGEALFGLEYRNYNITTSISGKAFSIPDNVYIIGTMNTADYALSQLDYAIRRRFCFVKMEAREPERIGRIRK
ncbi:MAG: AAA family ATPase [Ruminococcus sp.]